MIVVFGSINVDLVFPVASLPRHGETVLSEEGRVEPGGKGANQAIAAAHDGARVIFAGAVGRDPLAQVALAGLRAAGVDLARVRDREGCTGRAAITVDPEGRNTIVTAAGANLRARADQVEDELLGPSTTLLLQMETAVAENEALIRRARGRGTRIILNLAPALPIATDALEAVDLLVGNDTEIAWLGEHLGTGNNPASIQGALRVATLRTMGVQGAEIVSETAYRHMPAMQVDARDTTGAGDCFTGVLAAALDRGEAMEGAMRRAAVAAAISTTRRGVQGSLPRRNEIDAALDLAPAVVREQAEIED